MTREPWDQRLDETSAHYRLFVWWRDQAPRPPPSDLALARTYDWSSRAAAWDAARSVPTRFDEQITVAVRALGEACCIKARRALDRVRVDPDSDLDPRLAASIKSVVQIQAIMVESIRGQEANADTTEEERFAAALTAEEQRDFLCLLEKASR